MVAYQCSQLGFPRINRASWTMGSKDPRFPIYPFTDWFKEQGFPPRFTKAGIAAISVPGETTPRAFPQRFSKAQLEAYSRLISANTQKSGDTKKIESDITTGLDAGLAKFIKDFGFHPNQIKFGDQDDALYVQAVHNEMIVPAQLKFQQYAQEACKKAQSTTATSKKTADGKEEVTTDPTQMSSWMRWVIVCLLFALFVCTLINGGAATEEVRVFGKLTPTAIALTLVTGFALATKTLGHPVYTYMALAPLLLLQGSNMALEGLNMAWMWWASLGLAIINVSAFAMSTTGDLVNTWERARLLFMWKSKEEDDEDGLGSYKRQDIMDAELANQKVRV